MSERPEPTRRAVVLVGNPAAPYSRGLRVARALASAGYAVEIAAVAADGLPERERDGEIEIRRYWPSGPWRQLAASRASQAGSTGIGVSAVPPTGVAPTEGARPTVAPAASAAPATPTAQTVPTSSAPVPRRRAGRGRSLAIRARRWVSPTAWRGRLASVRRWVLWPHTVRGWWHTLERDLAPADLYHACGSLTIAPALARRERDRRAGRRAVVIYDAVDDVFEGNNVMDMPRPIRRVHAWRERRWAHAADARSTVNAALAERLAARWGLTEPPLVLPNYPQTPAFAPGAGVPKPSTDPIRAATGLPTSTRIVTFQGRLGPRLGLDEAADAVLGVPDAALVLIGFGRWFERCRARDGDPRFAGRHFTLPAVHPDELVAWTACADVALVPLPPVSVNQRLSTPNKFWEALSAGTPVVVGPGLDLMADLVREHDLGAVAASLEPAALASAIASVLNVSAADAVARRERIAALARDRFSWGAAAAAYLALVRECVRGASRGRD